ncbi:MAG: MBOAT family protein [Clostridia bacterium]|nr:MBOAT family protein [Clostridia bacterium]
MVFSHPFFVYAFLAFLFVAFFASKNNTVRRGVLITFSLVFYGWGEPVFVFLMICTVGFDFLFGRLIASYGDGHENQKKLWLVFAIITNLGILAFFKYTGFLVQTVNLLPLVNIPVPKITMPIGISFFTFQAMSYVIDVYRGDTPVQRSFARLLLYVSLFPQLIAGPIVRYKDIEDQLDDMHVKPFQLNDGIYRFAVGCAKKLLIADSCFAAAEALYSLPDVTFAGRWMGAVFFALQIYYDFSGYSDMAIGLGKMFGFEFLENFNYPYSSKSATEFWRRWHMSLGTFFRDYVYIPLGGNRSHHIRNILVVWFLTGLWHGASWNFVLWGMFYGLLLIFEKKFFLGFLERINKYLSAVISRVYTAFITVFGFALFYFTDNTAKSLGYLFGVGVDGFSDIFTTSIVMDNLNLLIVGIVLAYPVIPFITSKFKQRFRISYETRRYVMTATSLILIAVSTVRMIGDTYSPFLYWNF